MARCTNAMAKGDRYRLTGRLVEGRSGLILEMDGGGYWLLDATRSAAAWLGQRVTIEGVRSEFNRLDVERIERA